MIWFLSRGRQQVDLEVRRAPDADAYELVVTGPDGLENIERFEDPHRLVERTLRVQSRLIRQGWEPTSPLAPYASASSLTSKRRGRVALFGLAVRRSVRRLAAGLGL
jgi:hypothetical protein